MFNINRYNRRFFIYQPLKYYIMETILNLYCSAYWNTKNNYSSCRITDINGQELEFKEYYTGNQNLSEFVAVVWGIKHLAENNKEGAVYTVSETALSWINKKRITSSFDLSTSPTLKEDINQALEFLKRTNATSIKACYWSSKENGKIPSKY